MQAMKETRDLVYNILHCSKPIVSGIRGWAVGADLQRPAGRCRSQPRMQLMDGHTKIGVAAGDCAMIVWPLLVEHGERRVLPPCCERLNGEEAERIGPVSMAVPDEEVRQRPSRSRSTSRRARRPPSAGLVFAQQLDQECGSIFDASVAYEFMGFSGVEGWKA